MVCCPVFSRSTADAVPDELIRDLGFEKRPFAPSAGRKEEFRKRWDYQSLRDAPPLTVPENGEDQILTVHRGIVPIRNLQNRDFAIAGGIVSPSV